MEKITTLLFLLVIVSFIGCDEHDADPIPAKKIRAEKVQHGNYFYRLLTYNDQDQVVKIATGLIVEEDTTEVVHEVVYGNAGVEKILVQPGWEIQYVYEGNLITESYEYIGDVLQQSNHYEYDARNRLTSWIIMRNPDGEGFVPAVWQAYYYNEQDNLIQSKYHLYDATERIYHLTSTTVYEDFDDKKNSNQLFWTNLYNPNYTPLKNNPKVWRVTNENGSQGEERVHYEYNEFGYVTRQESEMGGYPIEYTFEEYK